MADVRRIQVSGGSDGSAEGGNSAYLLPDEKVLVDPGPPTESAWDRLRDGVTAAGLALEAIDHVLVTHWHADHTGNAARLHEAADATLAMHAHDAPLVADYAAERARRLDRDAATLERWGVPADQVATLVDFDSPSPVPDSVPVRELADGETVAGIEVLHTPGHTAGHAAFVLDDVGFVGDAVLRTCTPNVGGGDTRQDDPLTAYRRTLSRLEARVEVARPGHGGSFPLAPRAAELRAHHRERSGRALAALAAVEPATPWALAERLFGEMAGYHVKFGAGEAYAHLEHLRSAGLVARVADDPLAYETAHDAAGDDPERLADAAAGVWNADAPD
ncbi:MBL fold metallo-hydrolase [Haloarchaeobius iranensis]|uniref:Glyoxylase, beta-lactamase superfamily II n=1 Tax=Haloarchaeobius iranensis TaxID=996166 RepID=A0A1G9UFM3_9EURY|nr:MBL fold metallo-hydrolase [Haloarchaeobius iranensis]SDM58623.1 Glyoxylase, beta-lactamase superfamily II [Haloarchaeobius iranensis]